jgi:hypothetical protein
MVIVMVSCYLMFDSYFLLLLNLCYQLFYKKLNVFLILHFNVVLLFLLFKFDHYCFNCYFFNL